MKNHLVSFCCFTLAVSLVGCTKEPSVPSAPNPMTEPLSTTVDGSKFLLESEPEGASNVIKVREHASDGEDILIVGRIGGSENPWVEGRAAFSIVDRSLKACSDIEGDNCSTPWDYCCETSNLPAATALVKVVDDAGDLIQADARELLAVKELSTVVVKGKAQRDEAGNLTVLASSVFVKMK